MQSTTNPNTPFSKVPLRKSMDVLEYDTHPLPRLFQWWYTWTAIPEPAVPASFVKRETARRSRLVSIITFLLIILFIIFLPASFVSPSPLDLPLTITMLAVCFGTLFFNRFGLVILAGIIIVIAFEAALSITIFTMLPLTELTTGLYSLYVIGEFLAVSLLPKEFVFLAAIVNISLVWLSLTYQPKTPTLITDMGHGQFASILALWVGLQIIVASIAYIWVNNANRALRRADRAQVVAALEHKLGQQSMLAGQEKQELEESIQQLVSAYVDATKNQLATKIPYPPAKILWPLVGVMNALWLRLQRSNQIEQDLQRLEQAITGYTEILRAPERFVEQPLPPYTTKTALDPLISAFGQVHNVTRTRRK